MAKTKWKLPAAVEPGSTKCASIIIPDDPDYIAALTGALYELSKPYAWADDDDHTALLVGQRMFQAFETLTIDDDCTATPLPWCGLSNFHDSGEGDIWEASQFDSRGLSAWSIFTHGYFLEGRYNVNGASQLCVIHAHFTEAIHVTRLRIGWVCVPLSHVANSNAFAAPTSDPNNESVYIQTENKAADWNGFADTGDVDWNTTDLIIRAQANSDDPGNACTANLVIQGVNIYGDGPAPSGMDIC